MMDEQNKPRPFSLQDQERLTEAVIEPMAGEGLRTIGIAYKKITIGKYSHTSYVCVCVCVCVSIFGHLYCLCSLAFGRRKSERMS